MSKKEEFVKCEVCERDKKKAEYYTSGNPKHKQGCITICKKCAMNMVDMNNVETLKSFLKRVDRPFIYSLYQSALNSKRRSSLLGNYFTNIGMGTYKNLDYSQSEGIEDALKENYKERFQTDAEIKEEAKLQQKTELQLELDELEMTEKQLKEYRIFWGNGYTPYEYDSFQKRYDSLIGNYPNKTALHVENLKTYVVYKIKSEHLVASNNPDKDQIKLYTELAIKQATMAKLNLDKLTASDLSQNLNSISEIAILVEKHLDIIPILPKFIEKPNDAIDVAILSIINYNRRMKGMEDAEQSDVYDFYQDRLKEFKENENTDEIIKKNIVEKTIITESGKKKTILFYDFYKVVEERQKELPNDKFVKNLKKWTEFISYFRFFPCAFYQMLETETSQIRLSSDQKMILRICSRFPHSYLVFPRGFGKTMLNVMSMYHACILYPNLTYALTSQTRESSAKLLNSKVREIEDSYPMIKEEIKFFKFQKEDFEMGFKSGGIMSNLANNRASLGLRRHKLMVEEYAQCDDELLNEVIYPIVDIPRRTVGKLGVMSPYENNGGMTFITTSYFVNTPPFYKGLDMMEKMINLEGSMNIGASYLVPLAYGRGAPRSVIMQKKAEMPPLNFAQNYESIWVGVTNNALVDISKVMNLRTLTRAELEGKKSAEYIIAVDVARSENDSNNRCCATVVKVIRSKVGKITKLQLVNIVDIPATKNFRAQAQDIMKLRAKYDAKRVVIDANGLNS